MMRELAYIMPDYDGPMEYRALPHVANSDLKEIVMRHHGKTRPDNLEQVFAFGNLVDAMLLEPHKANMNHAKLEVAMAMKKTFFKDSLIRQIFNISDFRRQHEFYRLNIHGVRGAKCKTDGDSKIFNLVFELKGLSVNNEAQFEEAIDHLDYDQAAAWYIDITRRKNYLIAAISKTNTDRMFKRILDNQHKIYSRGVEKIKNSVKIWKQNGYV